MSTLVALYFWGGDDTIERFWGKRIAARGIYQSSVDSSHSNIVKTSGLRWLCLMLLVLIPWALPFFTVLAPSKRYNENQNRRHRCVIGYPIEKFMLWLIVVLPPLTHRLFPNTKTAENTV
ncbi:hypothetical protein IQ218_08840 [Synechocystis salina LEGE 06099]|uniref:hypothetical protein n=1 Tax=Synechocystis salina TaxID=945780 RepID=UPI001882A4EE|nr:hypothetical protein [Synechocystis salina]MBE9203536.1 hypothetical protein [Synechocystis salina LEGE 06099]